MDILLNEFYKRELDYYQMQTDIMKSLSTAKGFYEFYYSELKHWKDEQACFSFCNSFFKLQFGKYRYTDFEHFRGNIKFRLKENLEPKTTAAILERQFLLAWFAENNFSCWEAFKAVILIFYAEITAERLYKFYANGDVSVDILKKVGHVKLIINPV